MDAISQVLNTDEEGYLVEPQDWNEDIAKQLAAQESIRLTEDHWDAIRFMREYYADHQIAPDVRHVMKHLEKRLGAESRNAIFELFPLRLREAGLQDRWHETPARLEHRLRR